MAVFKFSSDERDDRLSFAVTTCWLNKLDSVEEHDWSQFGKVRSALARRLKTPPRTKPR
jgi:hypothetical protein